MDCIFCDIVAHKSPAWIIYQDSDITAFFDYFPASKGHLLIVPNIHNSDIYDVPDTTLQKIASLSKKIALFYKEHLDIPALNILQNNGQAAGQVVFHYHMHLIPRIPWDNITLWWTPDESHRDSYDELRDYIQKNFS